MVDTTAIANDESAAAAAATAASVSTTTENAAVEAAARLARQWAADKAALTAAEAKALEARASLMAASADSIEREQYVKQLEATCIKAAQRQKNFALLEKAAFFDDNTHSYWTPVTGGANVPALNDLLRPFGFAFGDRVLSGTAMPRRGKPVVIKSGANIARAPAGAFLHKARLQDKSKDLSKRERRAEHAFAAFYQTDGGGVLGGRLALFGDSNCLDSSHTPGECFDFLVSTLKYLTEHDRGAGVTDDEKHVAEAYDCGDPEPTRRRDTDMASLSTTLGGRPGNEGRAACGPNDPLEFHERPEEAVYNVPAWSARHARATIESRPAGWRETFARGAADLERGLEEGLGEILPRNDARIPEDDDEYGDASSSRAETGVRTVADRRRGTVADRRRESPSTTDANVPSTIGGVDERAGERPGGFRLDRGKATGWMSAGGAATTRTSRGGESMGISS